MLSKEEIKSSDAIAHKIVSDCLLYEPRIAPTCIKERISGLEYMLDIGKSLPESHPIREQMPKISDIINGIKEEAFIIVAPER